MKTTLRSDVELQIPEDAYGHRTKAIREVVRAAHTLEWFPPFSSTAQVPTAVGSHVAEHLRDLSEALVRPIGAPIEYERGDWSLLGRLFDLANNRVGSDDPSHSFGSWRRDLGQLNQVLQAELEASRAVDLLKPPLYPTGSAGVLGRVLTTDRMGGPKEIADVNLRQTVWHLMCDVESDYWKTILWILARGASPSGNPFAPLLKVYAMGFYPLGLVSGRFVVFSRAESAP